MEKKPHIGIGIDSFSKLITEKCLYVDKTDLIRDILKSKKEVILFTRPRRFGKSLAMSMLADFFDITKKEENAHLFDGLKISEYPEICREHQNAYPVISLSFKDIYGETPEGALIALRDLIAELYQGAEETLLPGIKNEAQRNYFLNIEWKKYGSDELSNSLRFLTELLHRHYGLPAIVLLDEYDVPLQKAFVGGHYKKVLIPIQKMMSAVFKGNKSLKFGVITGCLRVSKNSIFTGLNNISVNTILTEGYPEYFGFTPSETEQLLTDCGLASKIRTVRQWYNGYRFGSNEIYNPWSVLQFADQGIHKPDSAAQPYWANTSGNDILEYLVQFYYDESLDFRGDIKRLLDGGAIIKPITENSVFGDFDKKPDSIWSILLFTGYLKLRSSAIRINGEGNYRLVLPNKEVREILLGFFSRWFTAKTVSSRLPDLAEKFLTGDAESAAAEITGYMEDAVSLRDSHEAYYQGMLTTLMRPGNGQSYTVSNEQESGKGYPDIIVKEKARSIYAVIEIKRAAAPRASASASPEKWETQLDKSFEDALDKAENQIRNRTYVPKKAREFQNHFAYAAAFYNKECRIRKIEIF